jgi:hypothetical protein
MPRSCLRERILPLVIAAGALILLAAAPPTCPSKDLSGRGRPLHIELIVLPFNIAEQPTIASVADSETTFSFQPVNSAVDVAMERHAHNGAAGASQSPDQPVAVVSDLENLILLVKCLPPASTVQINASSLGPVVASDADPLARPGANEELSERAAAAGVHLTLHRAG